MPQEGRISDLKQAEAGAFKMDWQGCLGGDLV